MLSYENPRAGLPMTDTFKMYGLPESIRSDNGPPFACSQALLELSKLSVWWIRLGIKLKRGRVGCPQDNRAHERMHKDMSAELAAEHADTQAKMDERRDCCNYQRPHAALKGKTPGEIYTPNKRGLLRFVLCQIAVLLEEEGNAFGVVRELAAVGFLDGRIQFEVCFV